MNSTLELTFDYYQVGGSLKPNAPSYVKRQADKQLYDALMVGEFCCVFNSRQMGKSSLRVQAMHELKQSGVSCAAVDITRIGSEHLTPENWYGGIVSDLWRGFNLFGKVNQKNWLQEHQELSLVQLLDRFIEEVLLVHVPGKRIVIFVDEIDSIISLDFSSDDFFALIRACYNQRVDQPEYERLTFCLLGVATPSDLIRDKARTPFNIGKAIALDGFKFKEAQTLENGLLGKVSDPQEVLREILYWTGGQPFLTQKLCQLISEGSTVENPLSVEQVVMSKIIENWESQDQPEHLKTIRDRLLANKHRTQQILGLYQSILLQEEIDADPSYEQMELRLSGLVVKHNGKLKVYNPIYKKVFNQKWLIQELEKLRPYAEALSAWVGSHYQDDSRLLRGQAFEEGWNWLVDKGLDRQNKFSIDEHRFLIASRVLDKRGTLAEADRQTIEIAEELLQKVSNPMRVIRKVLKVTRSEPVLAQKLFRLILNEQFPICQGEDEADWVERMVRKRIIDNWEFQDQPEHLRKIRDDLVRNKDAENLLSLYRQVLLSEKVIANDSPKQLVLLRLGLVVNYQGQLEVGNHIYESIFNQNWAGNELGKIKSQKQWQRLKLVMVTGIILAVGLGTYRGIDLLSSASRCPLQEVLLNTCIATLAKVKNVPSGTFYYGGSTSFAPLRSPDVIAAINKAQPSFNLEYTHPKEKKPGSRTGIEMLLNGELNFAQSSDTLKPYESQDATKKGFTLEQRPVAIDGIAVYVNLGLPIRGLTLQQVQQIFAGEITNWQQVGGPNLNITVFSRNPKAGGTVDFFQNKVLAGKEFGSFEEVNNTTESLNKVAKTLGGIGYATASEVVNQKTVHVKLLPLAWSADKPYIPPFSGTNIDMVNQQAFTNDSYPITRKLYIIIKKDGGRDEQAGIAYANLLLSVEGQKLVEQAGFAPIRLRPLTSK
ncbi:substrate-binding domain-containing protein [Brasilonema sp. CT11]|nr:substrate-binding domain-containing protein [Brasilonema sp. CT11]